ncbi:MAG: hypothetical protein ABFS19_02305 [Thermodesulfobacteriota bacterium]
MKDTALTRQRTDVQARENTSVEAEVSKLAAISIAAFGAVIGLWSLACLASAMIQAGGPLQLAASWFKAVSGV